MSSARVVCKLLAVKSFSSGSVRRSGFDGWLDLSRGSLKRGSWPPGVDKTMSIYLVNAEPSRIGH